jgi:hypothetical protein
MPEKLSPDDRKEEDVPKKEEKPEEGQLPIICAKPGQHLDDEIIKPGDIPRGWHL